MLRTAVTGFGVVVHFRQHRKTTYVRRVWTITKMDLALSNDLCRFLALVSCKQTCAFARARCPHHLPTTWHVKSIQMWNVQPQAGNFRLQKPFHSNRRGQHSLETPLRLAIFPLSTQVQQKPPKKVATTPVHERTPSFRVLELFDCCAKFWCRLILIRRFK